MRAHTIFWALLILSLTAFLALYLYIWFVSGHILNLFAIQVAGVSRLRSILNGWMAAPIEGHNLLHYARLGTWLDFPWIIGYTGVLTMITYAIMQRQRNPALNNLLRLALIFPLLAGVFNLLQDIVLLYDLHDYTPYKKLVSSMAFAWIKWLFIAFVIAGWGLAAINSILWRKRRYYFH